MKLLYFIVLTGLCMACHQPRVYRINGSLPGALDGYVVKLYNIDTYPDVLLDSTVIKDENPAGRNQDFRVSEILPFSSRYDSR